MDLAELASRLEARLEMELRDSRVRHSLAVAELSAELCARWGLAPERGRVAALGHDLCKEMDAARQEFLASIYASHSGQSFVRDGLIREAALHGPAAAGFFILEYGCRDKDILEAIALHTLGGPEMGDLARLVYAADKLEPGRRHIDQDFRKRCLMLPPDEMFSTVFASTVEWLRSAGLPVADQSMALYDQPFSGRSKHEANL